MGGLRCQPEVLKLFNLFTRVEDLSQDVEIATESNPVVTRFGAGCQGTIPSKAPVPHRAPFLRDV